VSISSTAQTQRDLFLKNMAALWRADPRLAQRVDAVMDDQRLALEPTKSGAWTARMPTPGGRPCYLHSRYNPVDEADKLLAPTDFDEAYCFVLGGFGLGYHVRAAFSRLKGDAMLIVVEPSLNVLATALGCVDLAEPLASGRLLILTEANKSVIHETLRPHAALIMLGVKIIAHPPSQQIASEFHAALRTLITEYVTYARVALMTLVSNAEITCRNIAYNLATLVATPPIDILRNRFSGCPGLIVSAGPSLRKNIDRIADAKGRAVMFAVQTTYKPLLQRGIVPDFVLSLDFHEISRQYFEGTDSRGDVHLVAEPKATWHVVDHFRGPISLLDNAFARLLIGDELVGRDGLPAGATVAHLAFYLAEYVGCDPIIFVGQDLAYTGYVFYVPGVDIHQTWRSEINRFNTMEMKEWERIVRNRDILRKVKDAEGRELYSDDLLFTYLEQFEKDFMKATARLIDATEGGAYIRGTQVMPLRDALDQFCRRPIPPERFAYRREVRWYDPSRLNAARAELADRIEGVRTVRSICDEMTDLLGELKTLVHDPDRFNRRLGRVDELRAVLRSSDRAYSIISAASQLAELRRFSADRKLSAASHEGADRARRQIERDLEFVGSVRTGADTVSEMLSVALERLDRAIAEGRAS
jgi:hypothetical protein